MSVSYREATETREKGADSHREFCGTFGNQEKVSNPDLEPHVLQLLRRFPVNTPLRLARVDAHNHTQTLSSCLVLPPATSHH